MANEPNPNNNETNNTPDTAALEARIKELENENGKLRKTNTEASADASKWKKQFLETDEKLKAKMSDEEKAKVSQAEAQAAMQQRIDELEAKERTATLVSIGFDNETAEAFANAFKESNFDGLAEGIRKFIDLHDKALNDSQMQNNPTINSNGKTTVTMTRDEILAIKDPVLRQQKMAENIELFT